MTFGNVFESLATGGHPAPVAGWVHVAVWPVLVLVAVCARGRR